MREARQMVIEVFAQFDVNYDHVLDKEEMRQWFELAKEKNEPILTAFRAHEASIDDFDLTYAFIDKDGDGSVDREEMLAFFIAYKIKEAYPEREARLVEAERATEEMWPELDEDGDGFVDKEEFRRWYDPREEELTQMSMEESAKAIDWSNYDGVFSAADVDGDGRIEKYEMVDFLVLLQETKDKIEDSAKAQAKVKEIFDYYDADGDEQIDKEEFKNVLYYYYYDLQKIKDINVDELDDAWNYIDRDGDGKISNSELEAVYMEVYAQERRAALKKK